MAAGAKTAFQALSSDRPPFLVMPALNVTVSLLAGLRVPS